MKGEVLRVFWGVHRMGFWERGGYFFGIVVSSSHGRREGNTSALYLSSGSSRTV